MCVYYTVLLIDWINFGIFYVFGCVCYDVQCVQVSVFVCPIMCDRVCICVSHLAWLFFCFVSLSVVCVFDFFGVCIVLFLFLCVVCYVYVCGLLCVWMSLSVLPCEFVMVCCCVFASACAHLQCITAGVCYSCWCSVCLCVDSCVFLFPCVCVSFWVSDCSYMSFWFYVAVDLRLFLV